MEMIRQRSFIKHSSKHQRSVTIEYTIRSNKEDLNNIFLIFNEFLPSLIIRDQHNTVLPLMPSKDLKILYKMMINDPDGKEKKLLKQRLEKICNNKEHVIWFSLKQMPMQENEIRTFTLTYIPENQHKDNSYMKIKIEKQAYPVYYSLFSPKNFDFVNSKYIYKKNNKTKKELKPPPFVKSFSGSQTLSLRITESEHDFILMYRLRVHKSAELLTAVGALLLMGLSTMFLVLQSWNNPAVQDILAKNTEIGLFVMGASLILPKLQNDDEVRRRLIKYYIAPFVLGVIILLGKVIF